MPSAFGFVFSSMLLFETMGFVPNHSRETSKGFDLDMFLDSLPIAVGGGLPAVASWPRAPTWGIIRSCQGCRQFQEYFYFCCAPISVAHHTYT